MFYGIETSVCYRNLTACNKHSHTATKVYQPLPPQTRFKPSPKRPTKAAPPPPGCLQRPSYAPKKPPTKTPLAVVPLKSHQPYTITHQPTFKNQLRANNPNNSSLFGGTSVTSPPPPPVPKNKPSVLQNAMLKPKPPVKLSFIQVSALEIDFCLSHLKIVTVNCF